MSAYLVATYQVTKPHVPPSSQLIPSPSSPYPKGPTRRRSKAATPPPTSPLLTSALSQAFVNQPTEHSHRFSPRPASSLGTITLPGDGRVFVLVFYMRGKRCRRFGYEIMVPSKRFLGPPVPRAFRMASGSRNFPGISQPVYLCEHAQDHWFSVRPTTVMIREMMLPMLSRHLIGAVEIDEFYRILEETETSPLHWSRQFSPSCAFCISIKPLVTRETQYTLAMPQPWASAVPICKKGLSAPMKPLAFLTAGQELSRELYVYGEI